jgi:hypothetical protein
MIVEPRGGFECVDIETMCLKPGNGWPGQVAAIILPAFSYPCKAESLRRPRQPREPAAYWIKKLVPASRPTRLEIEEDHLSIEQ